MSNEEIILGGGCFWCMEAVFQMIDGVVSVEPGYSGGHFPNPTYEDVCTDETGHAEVVKVQYDNTLIDLEGILEVFFSSHDPTTVNRQGDDVGTQYRSAVFYTEESQLRVIESYIDNLTKQKVFKNPIVTQVSRLETFYPAEQYHHNYFRNNPSKGYCKLVIKPKVDKVRSKFSTGKVQLKL